MDSEEASDHKTFMVGVVEVGWDRDLRHCHRLNREVAMLLQGAYVTE